MNTFLSLFTNQTKQPSQPKRLAYESTSSTEEFDLEVLMFPNEVSWSRLQCLIKRTQHCIQVCMYSFTSPEITEILVKLHKQGVRVEVIVDQSSIVTIGQKVGALVEAGIPVKTQKHLKYKIHHKFVCIDGTTWMTGSLNFSKASVKFNHENVVIGKNMPDKVENFVSQFKELWLSEQLDQVIWTKEMSKKHSSLEIAWTQQCQTALKKRQERKDNSFVLNLSQDASSKEQNEIEQIQIEAKIKPEFLAPRYSYEYYDPVKLEEENQDQKEELNEATSEEEKSDSQCDFQSDFEDDNELDQTLMEQLQGRSKIRQNLSKVLGQRTDVTKAYQKEIHRLTARVAELEQTLNPIENKNSFKKLTRSANKACAQKVSVLGKRPVIKKKTIENEQIKKRHKTNEEKKN